MITDTGDIRDFAIDGEKNNNFPKLAEKSTILANSYEYLFDYFGVYHGHSIYYLPINPNLDVTIQNIDSEKLYHRKLMGSKIPNDHFDKNILGIQVGNYFWILGDYIHNPSIWASASHNSYEVNGNHHFNLQHMHHYF